MALDTPDAIPNGSTVECDVCIVGAGAAGISLALELESADASVVLLEGGGLESPPVDDTHPYAGRSIGIPYSLLGSRLRYFGGTTNHWGGWCRPLDPIDFQVRPHVPYSGWPIQHADLHHHYLRAQQLCEIAPPGFHLPLDEPEERLTPFRDLGDPDFVLKIFRFSPPTRFGSRYRDAIRSSQRISCLLDSTVIELVTRAAGVDVVRVRAGAKSFRVRAGATVLAMGAIENARLLLHSSRRSGNLLGNGGGLVGRFFADHLGKTIGTILAATTTPYQRHWLGGIEMIPHLSFTDRFLMGESLLNCGIVFLSGPDQLLLDRHYLDESRLFGQGSQPHRFFRAIARLETAPNPDSQVKLTAEKDGFGVPRVELDWRLAGLEALCLNRLIEILARKFGALGWGRFQRTFHGEPEFEEGDFSAQYHHMGTTRMSRLPSEGVVDTDCRVHGTEDLYVAGSSVFPTFGFANPTLTIVALAVRLAAHLKRKALRA